MAQLSRPYQIAIVSVLVLFAAWFLLLRGHGSSNESNSPTTPSSVSSTNSSKASSSNASSAKLGEEEAKQAGTPTPVYKGAAPGVEGLTRAIRKAHEAVGTSQRYDRQLEQKSAKASEEAPPSAGAASAPAPSASAGASTTGARTASHSSKRESAGSAAAKSRSRTVRTTAAVEHELAAGKTVLILFWNPHASDDIVVHHEVEAVANSLKSRLVAAHYASSQEVGTFGSITRNITVSQTPTLLIIAPSRKVVTLTGFPDAYGIEQSIDEVAG